MAGQRKLLVLQILILSGTAVPPAGDHPGVEAVEGFQRIGKAQPLRFIIEVDVLVRHHIQGTVQNAGEGHIVPGGPLGGGDPPGIQTSGHAAQRGVRAKVGGKDLLHGGHMFVWDQGGHQPSVRTGKAADGEPVGGGPARPGAQLRPLVIVVPHPLGGRLPLQLREHHDDVQHRPPHGGGGVKGLVDGDEFHPVPLQNIPEPAKIGNGTGQAVQPVYDDLLNEALFHILHHPLKCGAVGIFSRKPPVLIHLHVLPGLTAAQVDLPLNGKAVRLVHRLTGIDGVQARPLPSLRLFLLGGPPHRTPAAQAVLIPALSL